MYLYLNKSGKKHDIEGADTFFSLLKNKEHFEIKNILTLAVSIFHKEHFTLLRKKVFFIKKMCVRTHHSYHIWKTKHLLLKVFFI